MKRPKCVKCAKNGKFDINMTMKELTINEIKEKMKKGKISGYPPFMIYLKYNYFECPICHWFLFKNKKYLPSLKVDGYDY